MLTRPNFGRKQGWTPVKPFNKARGLTFPGLFVRIYCMDSIEIPADILEAIDRMVASAKKQADTFDEHTLREAAVLGAGLVLLAQKESE